MGVLSPFQGRASPRRADCRLLLLYRAAPELVQARLPAPLRPLTVGGFGLVALEYARLERRATDWLPTGLAPGRDHLQLRYFVERSGSTAARATDYVHERHTSSLLGASWAARFRPAHARLCEAELERDACRLRLRVSSADGELLFLAAELAGELVGSVFAHARAAQELLREPRLQPIHALEVRARPFDDPALFPPGSASFDSAYQLLEARRVPLRAGRAAIAGGNLSSAASAPTC
jgi:hypothetical protein